MPVSFIVNWRALQKECYITNTEQMISAVFLPPAHKRNKAVNQLLFSQKQISAYCENSVYQPDLEAPKLCVNYALNRFF